VRKISLMRPIRKGPRGSEIATQSDAAQLLIQFEAARIALRRAFELSPLNLEYADTI
jgi:hypothetical protein